MKTHELYQELSRETFWAEKPRKLRWIAARYYTGVDCSLKPYCEPREYGDHKGSPLLSHEEAEMIKILR
jgi:hypothetical protein